MRPRDYLVRDVYLHELTTVCLYFVFFVLLCFLLVLSFFGFQILLFLDLCHYILRES